MDKYLVRDAKIALRDISKSNINAVVDAVNDIITDYAMALGDDFWDSATTEELNKTQEKKVWLGFYKGVRHRIAKALEKDKST